MELTYISVCSGIEAASVAWKPLGWSAVAFSEIDAFPSAVLAERHPETPNLGNMEKFHEWPDATIDLLVGGTPCQSFSVAGLRNGLDDPRGSLMLTYLSIARRYRPAWVVWENVPGVLSIDKGRAFGTFLGGLAELGYGFAYRVLDARFFGVPQRRRRVFVVGYLGDWRRAAAVLFERHSLSGNPPPGRKAGEGYTHDVAPSIGASGRGFERAGESRGQDPVIAYALTAPKSGPRNCVENEVFISHSLSADGFDASEDGTGIGALAAEPGMKQQSYIINNMQVRRLTTRECEILQGFEPDYTLITYRKKPAKDGPRYKALGNSMAVPVMRWIGERVEAASKL